MDRIFSVKTQQDAFIAALKLAVIAPTEEQSTRATELAEKIAQNLTLEQVAEGKRIAESQLSEENTGGEGREVNPGERLQ